MRTCVDPARDRDISRKLVLVGFMSLVEMGSMIQLVLGMLISLVFLLLQMQAQPFRDDGDNALAMYTATSLPLLFFSCVLFRSTEFFDFGQVKALLAEDTRDMYVVSSSFVIGVMSASIVLALVLSIPVLYVSLKVTRNAVVLRWSRDNYRVVPRLLSPGQHHTFLSHKWTTGQDQARAVKELLQELVPGLKSWLDVDDMRSKSGTSATDKDSFYRLIDEQHTIIAFLTGSRLESGQEAGKEVSDYFSSPPCLNEIRRGRQNGIPIIFLYETDPTHGGVSMEAHRRDCPEDLRALLDSAPIIDWHRVQVPCRVLPRLLPPLLPRLPASYTSCLASCLVACHATCHAACRTRCHTSYLLLPRPLPCRVAGIPGRELAEAGERGAARGESAASAQARRRGRVSPARGRASSRASEGAILCREDLPPLCQPKHPGRGRAGGGAAGAREDPWTRRNPRGELRPQGDGGMHALPPLPLDTHTRRDHAACRVRPQWDANPRLRAQANWSQLEPTGALCTEPNSETLCARPPCAV